MITSHDDYGYNGISYVEARKKMLEEGKVFSRKAWIGCRLIRPGVESDMEYLNYSAEGLIVEDCLRRVCDCKIQIWQPTQEDQAANDYVEITGYCTVGLPKKEVTTNGQCL